MLEHFDIIVKIAGGLAIIVGSIFSLSEKGKRFWRKTWENKQKKRQIPDLMIQMATSIDEIKQKQIFFEKELKTNGGASIKDHINILVAEKRIELDAAPYPAFRTTTTGENRYANHAYLTLVGANRISDLLGTGWRAFLSNKEEADNYYHRWIEISETSKIFRDKLEFQNSNGESMGKWWVTINFLGEIGEEEMWGGVLRPANEIATKIAKEHGWITS